MTDLATYLRIEFKQSKQRTQAIRKLVEKVGRLLVNARDEDQEKTWWWPYSLKKADGANQFELDWGPDKSKKSMSTQAMICASLNQMLTVNPTVLPHPAENDTLRGTLLEVAAKIKSELEETSSKAKELWPSATYGD